MSELVNVELVGHQQALDTLHALSADLQQKGIRSGLHVAAKPLVEAMRSLAPNDSQTPGNRLAESISKTTARPGRKVRTGAGDRVVKAESDEISLLVGPNKKWRGKGVGYIGWFTEMGTEPHDFTLKRGKVFHLGTMQDRGFVRKQAIRHPGSRGLHWQQKALALVEGQMESGFYAGLDKWIAKHGR